MRRTLILLALLLFPLSRAYAGDEPFMSNVYGRNTSSLNGEWSALVDPYDRGWRMRFQDNLKASGNSDFHEYSFDGALTLKVPGDWNCQMPEMKYYEGTVWYARHFDGHREAQLRQFLYFAGVSYRCRVFLNGSLVASHEGSFLPFQAEITDVVRDGDNFLAVEVSNRRQEDAIPAMDFDWWNYGGITRDVMLVRTPEIYVSDYCLSLDREVPGKINVHVSLSEARAEKISVEIPELRLRRSVSTDARGNADFCFTSGRLELWSPESPKLYDVTIRCAEDEIRDRIGFRTLAVDGTKILLNGRPIFCKSVSFHEEIPMRAGRACSREDAEYLIGEVCALGGNMVRLAHYPQNEYIVRLAEEKGIILWEEIPLWQKIKFSDAGTLAKALKMYKDMLYRDRNRCSVCFWGLANETRPSEARNAFLMKLHEEARAIDSTRLFSLADDIADCNPATGRIELNDPLTEVVDVVAINKYLGWYAKWDRSPEDLEWNVAPGKPLIISEFGGEALYGRHGDENVASSWSEEYQAKLYRDNLKTFGNIRNLAGISPWVLFDFRSPRRFLPGLQDGWNRKGLVSDKGEYKQSWYIMHEFYKSR